MSLKFSKPIKLLTHPDAPPPPGAQVLFDTLDSLNMTDLMQEVVDQAHAKEQALSSLAPTFKSLGEAFEQAAQNTKTLTDTISQTITVEGENFKSGSATKAETYKLLMSKPPQYSPIFFPPAPEIFTPPKNSKMSETATLTKAIQDFFDSTKVKVDAEKFVAVDWEKMMPSEDFEPGLFTVEGDEGETVKLPKIYKGEDLEKALVPGKQALVFSQKSDGTYMMTTPHVDLAKITGPIGISSGSFESVDNTSGDSTASLMLDIMKDNAALKQKLDQAQAQNAALKKEIAELTEYATDLGDSVEELENTHISITASYEDLKSSFYSIEKALMLLDATHVLDIASSPKFQMLPPDLMNVIVPLYKGAKAAIGKQMHQAKSEVYQNYESNTYKLSLHLPETHHDVAVNVGDYHQLSHSSKTGLHVTAMKNFAQDKPSVEDYADSVGVAVAHALKATKL